MWVLQEKTNRNNNNISYLSISHGGWGGIRTHEELTPLPVFKTGAFNRSATHPQRTGVTYTVALPLARPCDRLLLWSYNQLIALGVQLQ
jgi:hypothetical protein